MYKKQKKDRKKAKEKQNKEGKYILNNEEFPKKELKELINIFIEFYISEEEEDKKFIKRRMS